MCKNPAMPSSSSSPPAEPHRVVVLAVAPVIGYDLINEPMGELREGEDLATAARRIEAEHLTPLYNRLARAVRTKDRDTWIFVEPTPIVGEGVPTGLGRIKDNRTVYAPHFYNTAMEAGADYAPDAGWIEAYEAAVTAYPARHRMPVGITGLAQVNGLRGDTSIEERARFDNHYIETWSLWQDACVLARTAGSLFRLGGS